MADTKATAGFTAGAATPKGTVGPRSPSQCALLPLQGMARLQGGFWGRRQTVNRNVSIPHGIAMLEDSGALHNLRLAAGRDRGAYQMPLYRDANVYVVLEAIAWDRRHGEVDAYEEFFAATVELLAAAQADDGYLNSYVQVCNPEGRFADPEHGHELFCAGHLIQAAVADERTSGRSTLVQVARRFADYLCRTLLDEDSHLVGGHPEIETALVELYRQTKERRYLDLATVLLDRRGHRTLSPGRFGSSYFQDDTPVKDSYTVRGHAVRALYLAAGAIDCYIETADEPLLTASVAQWDDMVGTKAYVTGGVGSRHEGESFGAPFELPSDRAYCETCASIAAVQWSWRMLLVTGDARYAAFTERVLYNAFAAALGNDGKSYFYVNPLRSRGDHHRKPWYETACCPPNAMRLLASVEDYIATSTHDGVQIHQLVPCQLDTRVGEDQNFRLSVDTSYPWQGTATLRVDAKPDRAVSVSVRVPDWAPRFALELNGSHLDVEVDASGYASVDRRWETGDELTIRIPIQAHLVEPHPSIDALRCSLAIERGPFVYCIEGVDSDGLSLDSIRLSETDVLGDERTLTIAGEEIVTLVVNSFTLGEPGNPKWPYRYRDDGLRPAPGEEASHPRSVLAIPYYLWDNRGASDMRVWIPSSSS